MSKADPRDWSDEEIEALLERLEEHVDTDTELGQAVKSRRRDVLKAIGALGAGGVAGAAGMEAASQQAQAADTSVGQIGSSGSPVDVAIDEIKDDGGDVVADIDDTGDVDFKRGVASPAVTTDDLSTAEAGVWVYHDGVLQGVEKESDHADIAAAFNAAKANYGFSAAKYVIPAGDYGAVGTSFDFTNQTAFGAKVDLSGVRFVAEQDGDPVFDCTGSHQGLVLNLQGAQITGSSSATPSVGLLIARSDDNPSSNGYVMGGLFDGHYSVAALYSVGTEIWHFENMLFGNRNGDARMVARHGEKNVDNVTSPFDTIQGGSATRMLFENLTIRGNNDTEYGLEIGQCKNLSFDNISVNNGTTGGINFDLSLGDIEGPIIFEQLRVETFTGGSPDHFVGATAPSSGTNSLSGVQFISGRDVMTYNTAWWDTPNGVKPLDIRLGPWPKHFRAIGQGIRIGDDGSAGRSVGWYINTEQFGSVSCPNGTSILKTFAFVSDLSELSAADGAVAHDLQAAQMFFVDGGNPKFTIDYSQGNFIFGIGGAKLFKSGGDIVAEDDAGNTTTLT